MSVTDDEGERQLFDVPGRKEEEENQREGENGDESTMWMPSDISESEEEVTEREMCPESVPHTEIKELQSSKSNGE